MNIHPKARSFADMFEIVFLRESLFPILAEPQPPKGQMQDTGLVVETTITKRLYTLADALLATVNKIVLTHNDLHEKNVRMHPKEFAEAHANAEHFQRMHTATLGLLLQSVREEHPSVMGHRFSIANDWKIVGRPGEIWDLNVPTIFPLEHLSMNIIDRLELIFISSALETLADYKNSAGAVEAGEQVVGRINDKRTRVVYCLLDELYNEAESLPIGSNERAYIKEVYEIVLGVMWVLVEDEVSAVADTGKKFSIRKDWEVVAEQPKDPEFQFVVIPLGAGPNAARTLHSLVRSS